MQLTITTRFLALGATGALLLTACGSGSEDAEGDTSTPLDVHANTASTYKPNFNPFSDTANQGVQGLLYEPLMLHTPMKPGEYEPWLAESLEFNDDGTEVTIELRDDAQWSDGEPFTADDVAFTFNLMRDNPAANASALEIAEATANSETEVVITFDSPQFAFEPNIANTITVPEHVFADEDPIEFTNEEPVGSGPYELDEFSDQLYTLTKNEDHWNADAFEVEEVRYPAATEQTFTTSLQSGDLDWSGGFVSNIDDIFVSQDEEHRGYWYPGDGLVNLMVNQQHEPFDDADLREALSLAIDREQLAEVAMEDYTEPAHPTGLPLPAFEDVMAEEYEDAAFAHDPQAAEDLLDEAGYEMGSDGIRTTPDGEPMSYSLEIPSDYVDWVTMGGLLEEQLAEVGIELNPQGISFQAWVENRGGGNFDVTIASAAMGLSPYSLYRAMLSSEYKTDEETVVANFARWYDEDTDNYLNDYATTDDEEQQQAALDGLQSVMVDELPVIPMLQSPNWFQYNTQDWQGFPTENDPYSLGAPFQFPDNLIVLQHLTPAG